LSAILLVEQGDPLVGRALLNKLHNSLGPVAKLQGEVDINGMFAIINLHIINSIITYLAADGFPITTFKDVGGGRKAADAESFKSHR
jgi:hypothetical protein